MDKTSLITKEFLTPTFPMDKTSLITTAGMIINWVIKIHDFFTCVWRLYQITLGFFACLRKLGYYLRTSLVSCFSFLRLVFWFTVRFISGVCKFWTEARDAGAQVPTSDHCLDHNDHDKISSLEVEMVMEKLGIHFNPNGDKLQEMLDFAEFSILFEENEPSLEEVKEAFGVFDENNDGFINAEELEKVFHMLGLNQVSEVHCQEMITKRFHRNGGGRIDFSEFVKLVESSFCQPEIIPIK